MAGGFCISVFALVMKNDKVLLVRPQANPKWEEWAPNWKLYEPERLSSEYIKWRFPSSYVGEGEHPDETLRRIAQGQLGVWTYRAGEGKLLNFYEPSRRYPGRMHWDYCFVYRVELNEEPGPKPWFSAIEYVSVSRLIPADFGSGQGELLQALRIA
ncbi:MAG: NUDIX domain-containing protein [Nitrososphaerota archaeon]